MASIRKGVHSNNLFAQSHTFDFSENKMKETSSLKRNTQSAKVPQQTEEKRSQTTLKYAHLYLNIDSYSCNYIKAFLHIA